jgi:hypothetical protein
MPELGHMLTGPTFGDPGHAEGLTLGVRSAGVRAANRQSGATRALRYAVQRTDRLLVLVGDLEVGNVDVSAILDGDCDFGSPRCRV